jgi:hypothetical protein
MTQIPVGPSPRGLLRALIVLCLSTLFATLPRVAAATPDPVLEWIKITNDMTIATATTPLVTARTVALVSSFVFDVVNAIEPRRFESIHVTQKAPPHASPAAAAIQAAYAILVKVYATKPTMGASLTAQRDTSPAAIVSGPGKSDSISVGMAWGRRSATASGRGDLRTAQPQPDAQVPGRTGYRRVAADAKARRCAASRRSSSVCDDDAVGPAAAESIPAASSVRVAGDRATRPDERAIHRRLPRNENDGRVHGESAELRSVKARTVLGRQHSAVLEPDGVGRGHSAAFHAIGKRAFVRGPEHVDG